MLPVETDQNRLKMIKCSIIVQWVDTYVLPVETDQNRLKMIRQLFRADQGIMTESTIISDDKEVELQNTRKSSDQVVQKKQV